MPDAAVDAAHARTVAWAADPLNPAAPPVQRRTIIVSPPPKPGLLTRLFGPPRHEPRPLPIPEADPIVPPFPFPTTPVPAPVAPDAPAPAPVAEPLKLEPTPYPANYAYLPRAQRAYLRRLRKDEERAIRAHERARAAEERQAARAFEAEMRRWEKAERAWRKEEVKRQKTAAKHPHVHPAYFPRPLPQPAPVPTSSPAELAAAAPARPGQPTSFMLLPALEEFGVRRPFNPPAQPGDAAWPLMSRTMTHAIVDMSQEERVVAAMQGSMWTRATF
ncbi:hypothetical protein Q5752_000690 [Cryptotrichosporon argae]